MARTPRSATRIRPYAVGVEINAGQSATDTTTNGSYVGGTDIIDLTGSGTSKTGVLVDLPERASRRERSTRAPMRSASARSRWSATIPMACTFFQRRDDRRHCADGRYGLGHILHDDGGHFDRCCRRRNRRQHHRQSRGQRFGVWRIDHCHRRGLATALWCWARSPATSTMTAPSTLWALPPRQPRPTASTGNPQGGVGVPARGQRQRRHLSMRARPSQGGIAQPRHHPEPGHGRRRC